MDAHYSVKGAILTGRYTPPTHYVFKIESFSKLIKAIEDKYSSDKFDAEGFSWYILMCPDGTGKGKGNSISVFLCTTKSKIPADTKLFTKFILRVKDQTDGNRDVKIEDNHLYSPDNCSSGRVEFLSLAKLQDPKMGFLVDDTVIIEAEVTLLGLVMKE
ncbi:hypothetical protein ACOSQ3_000368 [Xanthoceras sorbifolium]